MSDLNAPESEIDSALLTKREWFAGMAMQGLLASEEQDSWGWYAAASVQAADALIAELNKEQE